MKMASLWSQMVKNAHSGNTDCGYGCPPLPRDHKFCKTIAAAVAAADATADAAANAAAAVDSAAAATADAAAAPVSYGQQQQ